MLPQGELSANPSGTFVFYKIWARMFPSRNSLDRDSHRFLQLHHSALTSCSEGIGETLLTLCDARAVLYMIMSQDNSRAGCSHKGSSLQTLPARLVLYNIWARMFLFQNSLDRDSHRLYAVASFCPGEWLRGDWRGSVVIV